MRQLHWPEFPPTLSGDGLVLRGWRSDDAVAVHEACQDQDIQRWTTIATPYLMEYAAGFVGVFAAEQWRTHSGALFAVTSPDDAVVGSCGLTYVDGTELVAEVGYWTAPWARGRGLAVAALSTLSRWALDIGVERLEALIEPDNLASCAVAAASGYDFEGVLRAKLLDGDTRRDLSVYARLDVHKG